MVAPILNRVDYHDEAQTLCKLSEWFEHCLYGLRLVRSEWERLASSQAHGVKRLLLG